MDMPPPKSISLDFMCGVRDDILGLRGLSMFVGISLITTLGWTSLILEVFS